MKNSTKELYNTLKSMTGKAELVTEEAIRLCLGNEAFEELRQNGCIEHCRVDEFGRHWYAV